MSLEQLEKDVAELKVQMAGLLVRQMGFSQPGNTAMMSARGVLREYPEFEEVIAYGRYFRQTGQLPPPGMESRRSDSRAG